MVCLAFALRQLMAGAVHLGFRHWIGQNISIPLRIVNTAIFVPSGIGRSFQGHFLKANANPNIKWLAQFPDTHQTDATAKPKRSTLVLNGKFNGSTDASLIS